MKKLLTASLLIAVGFLLLGSIPGFSKTVASHEWYDRNKFTGWNSNFRTFYRSVPDDYEYYMTTTSRIGGGWNYDTYQNYWHYARLTYAR